MDEIVLNFEDWEKILKDTVLVKLQAGYSEVVVKFRDSGRKGKR